MPVMAMLVYAGEVEAGERAVAPFRAFATPIVDMVKPMPYPEIYKLTEGAEVTGEAARSVFLETVERSDLFCVPTDPADERAERADRTECTATLPGGEISAQGVSAFPEFSEIPVARNVEGITGGTRTYAGVRGELLYESRGTKMIHTFSLIDLPRRTQAKGLNTGPAYTLRSLESMAISRADLPATVAPCTCRRDRARDDSDSSR